MAKAAPTQTMAAYLLPGMSIEIRVPIIQNRVSGYFASSDVDLTKFFGTVNNASALLRGFVVEDKRVGEITASENPAAVVYTHFSSPCGGFLAHGAASHPALIMPRSRAMRG